MVKHRRNDHHIVVPWSTTWIGLQSAWKQGMNQIVPSDSCLLTYEKHHTDVWPTTCIGLHGNKNVPSDGLVLSFLLTFGIPTTPTRWLTTWIGLHGNNRTIKLYHLIILCSYLKCLPHHRMLHNVVWSAWKEENDHIILCSHVPTSSDKLIYLDL